MTIHENNLDPLSLSRLRIEYAERPLLESLVDKDPIVEFSKWFSEAEASKLPLPNAMALATATPEGRPSLRVVLLKQVDFNGFVFFTNYKSRKGRELQLNPYASLNFHWTELERQVRIEGTVSKIADLESDEYFHSRPRGSQIGAWTSAQSDIIESRNKLEESAASIEKQYFNKPIPRPPHWGGFCLKPTSIEFWQGRTNRLHDRIQYVLKNDGSWSIQRLSP